MLFDRSELISKPCNGLSKDFEITCIGVGYRLSSHNDVETDVLWRSGIVPGEEYEALAELCDYLNSIHYDEILIFNRAQSSPSQSEPPIMNWDLDYVEFDAEVSVQEDEVVLEIPSQILARSPVDPEDPVKVGFFDHRTASDQSSDSEFSPPVGEGDRLTLELVTRGEQGDGVGFVDEFAVIVPGGSVGTEPTVEVTEVKDSYAFAELSGEN